MQCGRNAGLGAKPAAFTPVSPREGRYGSRHGERPAQHPLPLMGASNLVGKVLRCPEGAGQHGLRRSWGHLNSAPVRC